MLKIRAFTNSSGSAWWRLESVARHVNLNTEHEFLCFNAKQWTGDILDGDIIIFQMVINPDAITDAQRKGAKVIYEMDDLLTEKVGRQEINDNEMFVSGMTESIKRADMVTTTTQVLADKVKHLNDNIVVLPNYIDLSWWGDMARVKRNDEIRIGWAGGISHRADLIYIKPVVKRILEEYDNTHFVYCGAGGVSSASMSTELMYGEDLFKGIPGNRRDMYLGTSTDLWGIKSKTLYFDIAIAPLINDKFNDCKSNIKWQEYSMNGWAGVYSDEPPYSDITHALKAKTPDEFYKQIKYLIENPEKRAELALKSRADVIKNWTLDMNYPKYVEAYKKCLNQ